MRYTPKTRPFRQEHYRWMREGTPNFDDRVFEHISELEVVIRRDVKWVPPTTPIMKALENMAGSYRSLIVQTPTGEFRGLVTVMKTINYLGGGELFQVVEKRHGFNIYSALNKEPVETIMETNPVVAYIDEDMKSVLSKMVMYGAGIVPVLDREGRVRGVLSEHDLVKYLAGVVSIGLKIRDIMSTPVVTVNENSTLKEAMETMVRYGFRRTPVVDKDNVVVGLVTAVDIIREFGTHRLIARSTSGDIREVLNIPVSEIMVKEVAVVKEDDDVAEVAGIMLSRNISSLLVVDEDMTLKGIVTERDILYSIIAPK